MSPIFHTLQSERRWALAERVGGWIFDICCAVIACGVVATLTILWLVS